MQLPPPPPAPSAPPERHLLRTTLALLIAVLLIAGFVALGQIRRDQAPVVIEPSTAPEQIRALLEQTAEVRELPFLHTVDPEFVSSEELAAEVRRLVEEQGAALGLPDEEVLVALRLMSPGTDLERVLTDAAASSVIGFYEPDSQRLVIETGSELLTPAGEITLVHELTHAVTDQHFGLDALVSGDEPDDQFVARLALVEGDATFAMAQWAQRNLSFGDQLDAGFESAFQSIGAGVPGPAFLGVLALFPYLQGQVFVAALYEDGGWAAVNRAYQDPPATTEEVLHPEKYLAGGEPHASTDELLGTLASGEHDGEVGELFLRTLLQNEAVAEAWDAAAGWDGGAWSRSSAGSVTMVTHWDTEADADAFRAAMRIWADRAYPEASGGVSPLGDFFSLMGSCVHLSSEDPLTERLQILPQPCY